MRATIRVNNPSYRSATRYTLLPQTDLGSVSLLVAGLPLYITAKMKMDTSISLTASINGAFSYTASFSQTVTPTGS